jgi:sugar lactone lactonase YvrE
MASCAYRGRPVSGKLVLLGAPLLFLPGCAAGPIALIVALASSGGGGGGGGGVSATVSQLAIVSTLTQDFPGCGLTASELENIRKKAGFDQALVRGNTVTFTFDLQTNADGGKEVDLTASVRRADGSMVELEDPVVTCSAGKSARHCVESVKLLDDPGNGPFLFTLSPTLGTSGEDNFDLAPMTRVVAGDILRVSLADCQFAREAGCGDDDGPECAPRLEPRRVFLQFPSGGATRGDPKLVLLDESKNPHLATNVEERDAPPGLKELEWDTGDLFADESRNLIPFLVIEEEEIPAAGDRVDQDCKSFHLDNTQPQLLNVEVTSDPAGTGTHQNELVGQVVIRYTIQDEGSEPVDLDLDVILPESPDVILSTINGDQDLPPDQRLARAQGGAGDGIRALPTSPTARTYTFAWNSDFDLDRLNRAGKFVNRSRGIPLPGVDGVQFRLKVRASEGCAVSNEVAIETLEGNLISLNNRLTHAAAGVRAGRTPPGRNRVALEAATFSVISSIAADNLRGLLYLLDSGTSTVWSMEFDKDAEFLERIAGGGAIRQPEDPLEIVPLSRARFNSPIDAVVDPETGDVYLLEESGVLSRIVLEPSREYQPLLSPAVLRGPQAVTLESSSNGKILYIADTGNCRIIRYDISAGDAPDVDDEARATVISGELRVLKPATLECIGAQYPLIRNGCTFTRPDPTLRDDDCPPRFRNAPVGLAFKVWQGRRYLFVSEPLRDRISRLDLDFTPVPGGPAGGVLTRVLRNENCINAEPGARQPTPFQMFSLPGALRSLDEMDALFVATYGIGTQGFQGASRGVVFKGMLTPDPLDPGGAPIITPADVSHVAGRVSLEPGTTERLTCGCKNSKDTTYRDTDECLPENRVHFGNPSAVARDVSGALYICDSLNQRVWRQGTGDGKCVEMPLCEPEQQVDDGGRLESFVGGSGEGRNEQELTFQLARLVGQESGEVCIRPEVPRGEPALLSKLGELRGIAFVDDGTLFLAESLNGRVRLLDLETARVVTIAGREVDNPCDCVEAPAGPGLLATEAILNGPAAVAVFPPHRPRFGSPSRFWCQEDRAIYIADRQNHLVRKVDFNGAITICAGSGFGTGRVGTCPPVTQQPTDADDGAPADPLGIFLVFPAGLAVDLKGRVFIADARRRILMLDEAGATLRRVIGRGGGLDCFLDVNRTTGAITVKSGVTGVERGNSCPPCPGSPPCPDTNPCAQVPCPQDIDAPAPALAAYLSQPFEMAFGGGEDGEKYLYFADQDFNRVRRAVYNSGEESNSTNLFGEVVTVAGNGKLNPRVQAGELCEALKVPLNGPRGLDIDVALEPNVLYVSTESNSQLYRVILDDDNPAANRIENLAGALGVGSQGDGDDAVVAGLSSPSSVRLDAMGNVYVADTRNHTLRRFSPPPLPRRNAPINCPTVVDPQAPGLPCPAGAGNPQGGAPPGG